MKGKMTIQRFRKMLRIIEEQVTAEDQKRLVQGIKALVPDDRADLLDEIEEARKRIKRRIKDHSRPLGWRYPSR